MIRPGFRSVLVPLTAVLVLAVSLAGAQQGPPPLSLTALVNQAVSLFPQVEGDVADVQGKTLTLALARPTESRQGIVLEVFREGREIRHPRTGQVLGRAEQLLGRAVVTQASDRFSVATMEGTPVEAVQAGDRVRTPAGKVKLVLVKMVGPGIKANLAEAISNEVYEGLNRSGRFTVVLGDQITLWMTEKQISAESFMAGTGVREAADRVKAEHILALHITQVERKPFMEARLFGAGARDPLLAQSAFVPPSIKPAEPGRFSGSNAPSTAAQAEKKQRSLLARLLGWGDDPTAYSASESPIQLREVARFPFAIVSMDIAVAPSDKIPRLVVTEGERVYLYKIVNRVLEAEWTYYARWLGRVISVQLADLNGDGVLEVVVNRFETKLGMSSMIVGLKNGKADTLSDTYDGLLLAVDDKGAGVRQTLWAQRYREETFFDTGHVERLTLAKGRLSRDRTVPVPDTFRATGATYANVLGKDSRALVYIDGQSRLRIHTGIEEIWASTTVVGGGLPKIEVMRYIERGGRSYFYQLEPMPLAVDLDGDGVQEIVVPQNQNETGLLAIVFKGPAGIRFQLVASGFEGTVVGFGAIPPEESGPPSLIAGIVRYGTLTRRAGDTQIIMAGSADN